ncbi:MAG: ribonuclease HI family protein [Deltaproteobacteria bacterium]|nr:ribonuclease HI family protein [Deltaproteobacteria bacterium]MBI4197115.1 ribonuclease HI family protein [Deltaproteobacteria bacterium]
MPRRLRLCTDGAARGNPGPAGAGAVLFDGEGRVVEELTSYLGETTNNVAEYEALLLGLRKARELKATEIEIQADSELMVRQLSGEYRVKNEGLKPLFQEAVRLLREFEKYSIKHIDRSLNKEADRLANRAIDENY